MQVHRKLWFCSFTEVLIAATRLEIAKSVPLPVKTPYWFKTNLIIKKRLQYIFDNCLKYFNYSTSYWDWTRLLLNRITSLTYRNHTCNLQHTGYNTTPCSKALNGCFFTLEQIRMHYSFIVTIFIPSIPPLFSFFKFCITTFVVFIISGFSMPQWVSSE